MNKTIWLKICEYDELDNCNTIRFEVSEEWLKENINITVKEFLNEYTSEDSIELYALAVLNGAILNEDEIAS